MKYKTFEALVSLLDKVTGGALLHKLGSAIDYSEGYISRMYELHDRLSEQLDKLVEEPAESTPSLVVEEPLPSKSVNTDKAIADSTDEAFADINDPKQLEELPEQAVFKALFERRFGKLGRFPLALNGNTKHLSCDELYALLERIRNLETLDTLSKVVYTAALKVVVHRFGEDDSQLVLN
ncbi:hypothetical protein HC928_02295 [bacterium]|nr:hypothetical protein [bacterium]